MFNLSIEQEFEIAKVAAMAKKLTKRELEINLADLYRTMITKEAMYKKFLLEGAGIVTPIFEDRK